MLLNHFGQMQQQMADQFQQQMMFMLQMFNGMHREQMGVIREELDRIRELSMEVHTLRTKLAARAAEPADVRARPRTPEPRSRLRPAQESDPRERVARATSRSGVETLLAPRECASVLTLRRGRPRLDSRPDPRGEPLARPAAPPPDASNLDPEVHDWLNDRLVAIQSEQQTRWQRILGMLGQRS